MMPIVLSSRPFLTPRTWGSSMELAIYFHTGGSIAIPAHPMGERLHIQTEKKKKRSNFNHGLPLLLYKLTWSTK